MKKKIFITGATGFIGSHLCEMAIKKGFSVIGFDRYNPNNDHGWLNKTNYKNLKIVLGDVRDYDSVHKSMSGCSIVFHLAALGGIPYSYYSPAAYVKTNIEGTYNVLEAAKNLKVNSTIITSTSEVYGSAKYFPMDESHPLYAQSPYAASKIAADQLTLSYFNSYNLPVKIIRPFNTYGPRQSNRAVIPRIIIQCLLNKKSINLGNLKPTRDFNYVEDVCKAYFEILKNKKLNGKIINVGSNTNISIGNLAKVIMKMTGKKINIIQKNKIFRPTKSEVENLKCNNRLIKSSTRWTSNFNLKEGLKKTIDWIDKNKKNLKNEYQV